MNVFTEKMKVELFDGFIDVLDRGDEMQEKTTITRDRFPAVGLFLVAALGFIHERHPGLSANEALVIIHTEFMLVTESIKKGKYSPSEKPTLRVIQ